MKTLSIQSKILTLTLGSVLSTSSVLLIVVYWSAANLRAQLQNQVGAIASSASSDLTKALYQLCAVADQRNKQRLQHSTGVAREEMAKAGAITFGNKIT
ncbi:MAG: hypothetical protein ABSG53_17535, partial [Thermoguttaceae bacterium]